MLPHLLLLHLSLLFLLGLRLVPFLVAAQQLDGGSSCPITGPFSASETCVVCQNKASCARETGQFDAICYKGVEFSSLAQAKAYRCNFEAPQAFAEEVKPGAFIQCDISSASNTSQAAGDSLLEASCTFGLVAGGDPIVCTATQCTTQINSTELQCQSSSCDCSLTTGCSSDFATNLVESLSGELSWGCKVPPGGLTSLTKPTKCTWKVAGLPGGSAQAVCDAGECHLADTTVKYSDLDVLTEFKRSFANGEEALADWGNSTNDPCQWEGVACDSTAAVIQLLLEGRGLEGSLPPSDTLPRGLVELNLNNNSLTGTISPGWRLPVDLRTLLLARNRLTGAIPTAWSLPSKFTDLDLAGNQLNGSLLAAWQLPATMQLLSVSDNQLSGSLPVGWVLPSSLTHLSLRGNKLIGEAVTDGILLPNSLERYEVDMNQLGGNLVELAPRLPSQLKHLGLSNNYITGTLPPTWALPKGLERVDLSSNLLTGSIPSTWEPPPTLVALDLYNNSLNGTLPSWPELTDLNVTVAPNPGLCGTVPLAPEYTMREGGADQQSVSSPLESLPGCAADVAPSGSPPSGESGGGSSSIAIIVGAVAGACAILAAVVGIVLWRKARRQGLEETDLEKPTRDGEALESARSGPSSRSSAQISAAGIGRASGVRVEGSAEDEVEEPAGLAISRRSTVGTDRASTRESGGIGMAGGGEDVVASLGQARPGWGVSDMRLKVSRIPIQPSPFQTFIPALEDPDQDEHLNTPSAISSAGAPGSTQPSSLSSSGASKELLASDPLLSSIVVRLKTGAVRNPWVGSGSSSASAEQHHSWAGLGSSTRSKPLELSAAEETGVVVIGQRRRMTGSGSSSTSQRQLVDVGIWHLDFMDLHLIRQIGSGSFGRVYLAAWRETLVAVKLLLGEAAAIGNTEEAAEAVLSVTDPLLDNLKKEASLMAASRHPNVLGFMGLCTTPPCLISEYCHRGSLYDMLRSGKQLTSRALELTWSIRLQMVNGAALGMLYLHSFKPPIVHRDLKSNNLLIASNWMVKVADFNLSKIMELGGGEGSAVASSGASDVGNPRWLAPEVIAGKPHTFASDVFSFGIILWEVLTWEVPWAAVNFWQVTTNVQRGLRPPVPSADELPGAERGFVGLDRYVALLKKCWAQRPEDRPTFGEIVSELRQIQEAHKAELARQD